MTAPGKSTFYVTYLPVKTYHALYLVSNSSSSGRFGSFCEHSGERGSDELSKVIVKVFDCHNLNP